MASPPPDPFSSLMGSFAGFDPSSSSMNSMDDNEDLLLALGGLEAQLDRLVDIDEVVLPRAPSAPSAPGADVLGALSATPRLPPLAPTVASSVMSSLPPRLPDPPAPLPTEASGDAWSRSLAQFDAMAAHDFIAAEKGRQARSPVVRHADLDLEDVEEYDLAPPATTANATASSSLHDLFAGMAASRRNAAEGAVLSPPPLGVPPPGVPRPTKVPPAPPIPPAAAPSPPRARVPAGLPAGPPPNLPFVSGPRPPHQAGVVVPSPRHRPRPPPGSSSPLRPPPQAPQAGKGRGSQSPAPPPRRHPNHYSDPRAPPISPKSLASASMSSRDVAYVLGSILRALTMADPYVDDHYYYHHRERRGDGTGRNGAGGPPLAPRAGVSGRQLPLPAWKESRVRREKKDQEYRDVKEGRAKEWEEEKKVLGHTAKSDVHRPRALLAAPALRRQDETPASPSPDDRARTLLWRARAAIDAGYVAYLSLTELQRALGGPLSANMRENYLADVDAEIERLQAAFGVRGGSDGAVDEEALGRVLALPKGRELLARSVEGGMLPHPAACRVMAPALTALWHGGEHATPVSTKCKSEDRLLLAFCRVVRLVHPAFEMQHVMDCVDRAVGGRNSVLSAEKLRDTLGRGMMRVEMLMALLSRGNEICRNSNNDKEGNNTVDHNVAEAWAERERIFMGMIGSVQ